MEDEKQLHLRDEFLRYKLTASEIITTKKIWSAF